MCLFLLYVLAILEIFYVDNTYHRNTYTYWYGIVEFNVPLNGLRTLRTLDTSDPRQFGTMSLVPKWLTFFCRCRSVFGTLRHQCRTVSTFYEGADCPLDTSAPSSVSDRSAARSCSCIASQPHVTSAPSIAIYWQRVETFCIFLILIGPVYSG